MVRKGDIMNAPPSDVQGVTGLQGPTGLAGPTGPQGETGAGGGAAAPPTAHFAIEIFQEPPAVVAKQVVTQDLQDFLVWGQAGGPGEEGSGGAITIRATIQVDAGPEYGMPTDFRNGVDEFDFQKDFGISDVLGIVPQIAGHFLGGVKSAPAGTLTFRLYADDLHDLQGVSHLYLAILHVSFDNFDHPFGGEV